MGDSSLTQRLLVDPATNAIADRVENLVAALWDYTLGLLVNLILLCRHAQQLEKNMQRLSALKADLKNQAEQEIHRNPPAEMAHQLSRWSGSVDALAEKVSDFERTFGDRSWCSITLGHTAVQLLNEVNELTREGVALQSGGRLINQRGPDAVQLVPSEVSKASELVGAAEPLQKIKNYILDEGVGIIGIYGMGGVGKTTLLKVINNDFLTGSEGTGMFDVAIWVTVSREAKDIPRIQKTIANRLELPSHRPVDKGTLFRELSKRRFVLFLDDVWERLDLVGELGVPLPKDSKNNSKILFTTRSEEVCCQMGADEKVKLGCLDEDSSWELFRFKFGKNRVFDGDSLIKSLAKQVVKKCGGLPITLITMGRAMAAQAKTADDWRDAIIELDHRPADLAPGMENDVLLCLSFSLEKLGGKTLRDCLVYFALFPEDRNIWEEIRDYWICEGFLDSEDFFEPDIEDTRRRASKLVTKLQNASLLEVDDAQQYVSLHDTVRDTALWISKKEFVVLAGSNCIVSQVPTLAVWQKATRISLIDNEQVEEPPYSCWNLSCPNLTTLLLNNSRLGKNIADNQGFLTCTNMPALKVLNLSKVGLEVLPISITSLTTLQYLSLEDNNLTSLPVELGKLVNLRQLYLRRNKNLQPIPRAALSRLSSLQVLNMAKSGEKDGLQRSELQDLETLKRLSELHLRGNGIRSWELLQLIAESPVLRRCIRQIEGQFDDVSLQPPPTGEIISQQMNRLSERIKSLGLYADSNNPVTGELELYSDRLQHLEVLRIRYFVEAKISVIRGGAAPSLTKLTFLEIEGCGCSDLTWTGRLPCLKMLMVENCKELTEILLSNDEDIDEQTIPLSSLVFFPKLNLMCLKYLPSLRSISTRTLFLRSLVVLMVKSCPELRRLPFNGGSAPNIWRIQGSRTWWDGLEWQEITIQERFGSKLFCMS